MRRDLQLKDAEGVDCLPNATIFEQLALMGGPTASVVDKTVNEGMDDSLVRATTTASSLEAEQNSGNINKTQSKATPNESSPNGLIQVVVLGAKIPWGIPLLRLGKDVSRHGGISDINVDEGITLVSTPDNAGMFNVDQDLIGEEVFISQEVSLKESAKPKAGMVVIQEPEQGTATTTLTTTTAATTASTRPKAKRFFIHEQEQAPTPIVSSQQLSQVKKRRKFFAAKRAEEKRNKPPTQAQQRRIMCTYLKNMEGKKLKDLKKKSFDSIKKMVDRAFERVYTFVDFKTELVKESSKKAEVEIMEQESSKRTRTKLE
nr:hypothetical protein [Tanacetum cinerariifolium]